MASFIKKDVQQAGPGGGGKPSSAAQAASAHGDQEKPSLAVYAFGRFQPPTRMHLKLIEAVVALARKQGGVPYLFTSQKFNNQIPIHKRSAIQKTEKTTGKKVLIKNRKKQEENPLEIRDKLGYLEFYFGHTGINIVDISQYTSGLQIKTAGAADNWLSQNGFQNRILVIGGDRARQVYENWTKPPQEGGQLNQILPLTWFTARSLPIRPPFGIQSPGSHFIVPHELAREEQNTGAGCSGMLCDAAASAGAGEPAISGTQLRRWAVQNDINNFYAGLGGDQGCIAACKKRAQNLMLKIQQGISPAYHGFVGGRRKRKRKTKRRRKTKRKRRRKTRGKKKRKKRTKKTQRFQTWAYCKKHPKKKNLRCMFYKCPNGYRASCRCKPTKKTRRKKR